MQYFYISRGYDPSTTRKVLFSDKILIVQFGRYLTLLSENWQTYQGHEMTFDDNALFRHPELAEDNRLDDTVPGLLLEFFTVGCHHPHPTLAVISCTSDAVFHISRVNCP